MKGYLQTGMQLTSNGLAMVTEISNALSQLNIQGFNSRRLLSNELHIVRHSGFPRWISAGTRKLLAKKSKKIKPDLIVAKDGTGKYKTINEALKDIPENSDKTFVLYIKAGVYEEKVQFNRTMTHLMVVGDGPTKTRITGKLNFIDGTSTFHTATVGMCLPFHWICLLVFSSFYFSVNDCFHFHKLLWFFVKKHKEAFSLCFHDKFSFFLVMADAIICTK